jgi:hypothetical protein
MHRPPATGLVLDGECTDVLDAGSVVNISTANYTFRLPPRRARMWKR